MQFYSKGDVKVEKSGIISKEQAEIIVLENADMEAKDISRLKTKIENYYGKDIYDIEATIYCLRNSHKGIIIGKNGEMLKKIGRLARLDMEENFGVKINLKTWVKVKEDWQENSSIVNKFKLQ